MKLIPASRARWMTWMPASWSGSPQAPNIIAPRQRGLTLTPVVPSSRSSMPCNVVSMAMRATVMYEAGDVRVEDVPDAGIEQPTDALVRITHSCICGSDLWPYKSMERTDGGRRMGHEFVGVVEAVGSEVTSVKAGDVVIAPF